MASPNSSQDRVFDSKTAWTKACLNSGLWSPTSQPGLRGLLQLDGISHFWCPGGCCHDRWQRFTALEGSIDLDLENMIHSNSIISTTSICTCLKFSHMWELKTSLTGGSVSRPSKYVYICQVFLASSPTSKSNSLPGSEVNGGQLCPTLPKCPRYTAKVSGACPLCGPLPSLAFTQLLDRTSLRKKEREKKDTRPKVTWNK